MSHLIKVYAVCIFQLFSSLVGLLKVRTLSETGTRPKLYLKTCVPTYMAIKRTTDIAFMT